jgi:hypothetical protein
VTLSQVATRASKRDNYSFPEIKRTEDDGDWLDSNVRQLQVGEAIRNCR